MAQCPACQTKLNDDFGLVNCPGCGAVCFIDLDDNVTLQNEDFQSLDLEAAGNTNEVFDASETLEDDGFAVEEEESDLESQLEDPLVDSVEQNELDSLAENFEPFEDSALDDPLTTESYDGDANDADADYSADLLEQDSPEEFNYEASEDETDSLGVEDDYENEDEEIGIAGEDGLETIGFDEGGKMLDSSETPKTAAAMSLNDFLSEIEVFGNIDAEPFQQAAYFFNIKISSIDSKDIRTEILETLSNEKLGLNEEDLARKIVQGELKLNQIPAVKAAVIIQSLSLLNCELDWEMKEVQDLDQEELESDDLPPEGSAEDSLQYDDDDEFEIEAEDDSF